jgi:hypothetical protein
MSAEQRIAVKNARGLIAEPCIGKVHINNTFPHGVRV